MPHITNYGAALFSTIYVGNVGENDPNNMIEIPDLRGEPDIGTEPSTQDLEGFGRLVAPKIQVQGTQPDFEAAVNLRYGIPVHAAIVLAGGIPGGALVRPDTDTDHPNQIVLNQDGTIKATGARAGNEVAFGQGSSHAFVLMFRIQESGENDYFYATGSVAGTNFGPRTGDNTVGNFSLALSVPWAGALTLAN